jgi:hypothetical protein
MNERFTRGTPSRRAVSLDNQHVLAWHEALEEVGFSLGVWRIHRRIGMSGGLLVQALGREIGQRAHSSTGGRAPGTARQGPRALSCGDPATSRRSRAAAATESSQSSIRDRNQRPSGRRSTRARKIRSNGGDPGHHTAGGPARKAGSGPVSCRSRAAQRTHHESDGCGRQCTGSIGCPQSRMFRNRSAFRRLRERGAATGGRLSGVPGSGGFAGAPR